MSGGVPLDINWQQDGDVRNGQFEQSAPLSLVEECRGLALIGRELQSVSGASSLMP